MNIIKSHIDIGKESRPGKKLKDLRAIVTHWTGVPKQSFETVKKWWDDDENGIYGSAHYIIDLKGDVYETIPPNEVAYHCGSAESGYTEFAKKYFSPRICSNFDSPNNYTIGIELIPEDAEGNFTAATYLSAVELTEFLMEKNGLYTNNILMHSHIRKVSEKRCPLLWVSDPAKWEEFKLDVIR